MQLKDFDTLEEAQAFTAPLEKLISSDMIISLLTEYDSVTSLQESTDEKAKGFLLALNTGGIEFNLMQSHPIGQKQTMLLNYLVLVGAVSQGFADACIALANQTHNPFANATAFTFMKAKGQCPTIQIAPENGWLTIRTSEDCEFHRPQVYCEVSGVKVHVTTVSQGISTAGTYVVPVPRTYGVLHVDNPFGAIV